MASRAKRRQKYTNSSPEIVRLHPMTDAQGLLLESITDNPITIASGPAGTGKTLLALHEALWMHHKGEIDSVMYIKPNEPIGRTVGHLPGDIDEKILPMFYPVLDNLEVFCTPGKAKYLVDKKQVAFQLLEYMRGRSLRDTFLILDEAQNCTPTQVLTVITRMGKGCKLVVTGDPRQQDSRDYNNGLSDALARLKGCDSVGVVQFTASDIVRNSYLSDVIKRY